MSRPTARIRAAVLVAATAGALLAGTAAVAPVDASAAAPGYGPVLLEDPAAGQQAFLPEDYGAVGDGRHDDTAAIQQAIDASAGVGVVVLGEHNYLCNDQLSFPDHTRLVGTSVRSVLRFTWFLRSTGRHVGPYLQNSHGADQTFLPNTDLSFSNFTIVGANTSGQPSGQSADYPYALASAMRFIHADHVSIDHVAIRKTPGAAINFQGTHDVTVAHNNILYSGRGGIVLFWRNEEPTADVAITGNNIAYLGDDGIAVSNDTGDMPNTTGLMPTRISITANKVTGWPSDPNGKTQGRGIAVLGVTDSDVSGNTVSHTPQSGILVRGATVPDQVDVTTGLPWATNATTFTGNRVSYVGQSAPPDLVAHRKYWKMDGFEIDDSDAITVTGNIALHVVGLPFDVVDATNSTIGSNRGH